MIVTGSNQFMNILFGSMLLTLLISSPMPSSAGTGDLSGEQKEYCNRWAYRFLSIKDGANFMNNKISAKKFPRYVDLCLENYAELRNYYKNLKKGK